MTISSRLMVDQQRSLVWTICPRSNMYSSLPQWGPADAEIKVPSAAENPELSKVLHLKPGVGNNNNNNNEILIKLEPLVYTRARRAVQKNKQTNKN